MSPVRTATPGTTYYAVRAVTMYWSTPGATTRYTEAQGQTTSSTSSATAPTSMVGLASTTSSRSTAATRARTVTTTTPPVTSFQDPQTRSSVVLRPTGDFSPEPTRPQGWSA